MSAAERHTAPGPEDSLASASERVRVEVVGLSLYTHHGVSDAEQEIGQRLVIDLTIELDRCGATASDRLEETVDYGELAREVAAVARGRSYRTLERLCGAIAEHLHERFGVAAVTVRAAKPEPPLELSVDQVAVELRSGVT